MASSQPATSLNVIFSLAALSSVLTLARTCRSSDRTRTPVGPTPPAPAAPPRPRPRKRSQENLQRCAQRSKVRAHHAKEAARPAAAVLLVAGAAEPAAEAARHLAHLPVDQPARAAAAATSPHTAQRQMLLPRAPQPGPSPCDVCPRSHPPPATRKHDVGPHQKVAPRMSQHGPPGHSPCSSPPQHSPEGGAEDEQRGRHLQQRVDHADLVHVPAHATPHA